MILVDTSVILDLLGDDQKWASWSQTALEKAASTEELIINDVVYAELSTRYSSVEAVDAAIGALALRLTTIPRSALFLAGKAFQAYRANRGAKTGVLSDFFIGAHAAIEAVPLLTRDTRRVQTYFPSVKLIAP